MGPETITLDRLIAIAGLVVAAASVVLAVIFYLRQRHDKRPVWTVENFPLVTPAFQRSGLELRFGNMPLDAASLAELTFWNAGNDMIWEEDLSTTHPLRIEPHPGVQILSYEPVMQPKDPYGRPKMSLTSSGERDQISVSFTNLRPSEGAVISVIHTGSSRDDIRLESGRISGAAPLEQRPATDAGPTTIDLILMFTAMLVGLAGSVVLSALVINILRKYDQSNTLYIWAYVVVFVVLMVFGSERVIRSRRRATGMPPSLRHHSGRTDTADSRRRYP